MNESADYSKLIENFSVLYLPINVCSTLIVDGFLYSRLRGLSPPLRVVQGFFLLQLILLLDVVNLVCPTTHWLHYFIPLNTFSCKILQFFAREPYTLAEWACVLFASERASQRLGIGRAKFRVLRMKVGFSLFALVLGAAYTNYMWMYGLLNGHCLVLTEFLEAYYLYIIYTEPVVEFLVPHFLAISAFLVMLIAVVVVGDKNEVPRLDVESATKERVWIVFLDMTSITVTLTNCLMEAPKNVVKFISIVIAGPFMELDMVTIFYMISVGRFLVRGCLLTFLLLTFEWRLRRLRKSRIITF